MTNLLYVCFSGAWTCSGYARDVEKAVLSHADIDSFNILLRSFKQANYFNL